MAYNPSDFSVDEIKALLSSVKEATADNEESLGELLHNLEQIRSYCNYLITQCDDRLDELQDDGEDEEDENYDLQ